MKLVEHGVPVATRVVVWSAAVCALLTGGCTRQPSDVEPPAVATLRIGFGLPAGTTAETGIRQAARNLALEGLVSVGRDGRTQASLAESWTMTPDRLALQIHLRPSVTFHDGTPVDAEIIRQILEQQLPQVLGPASDDVAGIHIRSDRDLELTLRRPSTFPMERLDDAVIQKPETEIESVVPGTKPIGIGTGPFAIVRQDGKDIEMRANSNYYAEKPLIDRVIIRPYESVRAAWADLLRGEVDMVYEVGVDALDSLESSSEIRTFTFQRAYAFLMVLNTRKPHLSNPDIRRALNEAIDRDALVRDAFRGHATPAQGPVWPQHWAYSADFPRFGFRPKSLPPPAHFRLKCLFADQSHERLALLVQRQLRAIGVELDLEMVSAGEIATRAEKGDFDAFLVDFREGPNLARPYLNWHTGAPNNYGHYSNARVDAALDSVRHATDDGAYRAGVAAFQRAMIDDPPAVFLAWRQRARAVSTRFAVPDEPDKDVLASIRRWRPVGGATHVRRQN